MTLLEKAALAEKAARTSGEMLEHHGALHIQRKAENDFVTEMDLKSEQLIRGMLLSAFPEDGFFGAVPRAEDARTEPFPYTPSRLSLWVGPEGGFSPEEEQALRAKGLIPLTVGPWILRVETAVTALLGSLLTQFH